MADYDLLFVGSGLSTTYTLLGVLAGVTAKQRSDKVRIVVVDPSGGFNGGRAYSPASSVEPLLLTPLRSFLTEAERIGCMGWLQTTEVDDVADWRRAHPAAMSDELLDSCLPRWLVGRYLSHRVDVAVTAAESSGAAGVSFIEGSVHGFANDASGWQALLGDGRSVQATSVVLAIGSVPSEGCGIEFDELAQNRVLRPGRDGATEVVRRLGELASPDRTGRVNAPELLVLGANASACETIALVEEHLRQHPRKPRYTVVAPTGRLPDRHRPSSGATSVQTPALDAVRAAGNPSAAEICRAAASDLTSGRAEHANFSDVYETVTPIVGQLLSALPRSEHQVLADSLGRNLGKNTRWVSNEYAGPIECAISTGRLTLSHGRVARVSFSASHQRFCIDYSEPLGGRCLLDNVDIILDCTGPSQLSADHSDPLVRWLAANLSVNASGLGVVVDDTLAAASGMYIIGPLLTGNILHGKPVWHMEQASRIIELSGLLSGILLRAVGDD